MALHQERTPATIAMETSNFAHVIFQNVGKSYLPHAGLECHYTLTQFIRPHPKDWVGIFKVRTLAIAPSSVSPSLSLSLSLFHIPSLPPSLSGPLSRSPSSSPLRSFLSKREM